ncbi:MAG: response regulator [Nitrospirae bacterium]|nr:response regulator [Nitrospirota bacterium]
MASAKILVVEDDFFTAVVFRQLLELWGYEICEQVTSGEEAIARAEKEKPDIVLMDINLDGEIDGIEAATKIRVRFGIPIIFTTAYSDNETKEAARLADPVGYFVKPLNFNELRTMLNSIACN